MLVFVCCALRFPPLFKNVSSSAVLSIIVIAMAAEEKLLNVEQQWAYFYKVRAKVVACSISFLSSHVQEINLFNIKRRN